MKIAVIPIDNRPVCYNLVNLITNIDDGIELFMPKRALLGGLTTGANIDGIYSWLEGLPQVDAIVISLDTIAYGGLVASRRNIEDFESIKFRLEKFKSLIAEKNAKTYAFSSIMRISNNNINEEEKTYWNKFGKKIFDYSFNSHKYSGESCIKTLIPDSILDDYIATRQRNFNINKLYLNWLDENILDNLVYSKDDCAEFGFNVQEAKELKKLASGKNALVKTGADEIPLTLLTRAVVDYHNIKPKITPIFLAPDHIKLISKYEDVSIEKSVLSQIELAGCEVCTNASDISLIVNNFEENQGEIVMNVDTKSFSGELKLPQSPYIIADVRFANGADNYFIKKVFENNLNENFYGYSAWNTSANTLGSLICAGVIKLLAKNCTNKYNKTAFKKLQATRLLDDWAYQANIRQEIKKKTNTATDSNLNESMLEYENKIKNALQYDFCTKYSFPWGRFFEVEVEIN